MGVSMSGRSGGLNMKAGDIISPGGGDPSAQLLLIDHAVLVDVGCCYHLHDLLVGHVLACRAGCKRACARGPCVRPPHAHSHSHSHGHPHACGSVGRLTGAAHPARARPA
eukprot:scaffold34626_cov62-Phaeocystis_antarctica.AAC.1